MQTQEITFKTIGPFCDYMSRKDAAKYLNVSLPTFDIMLAKSKSGKLKPAIPAFRSGANSRVFFRKEKLDEWIELRELSKD